jgi:EmrB/QacA subfamily drug resistance transporter
MSDPAVGAVAAPRVAATAILASIGAFVTSLDIVVVVNALPTIKTHFNASLSDLEWTINAYNLVFAAMMLTGSALGDRFGRKRLYVIGLVLFSAASAACATAGSAGILITARTVQGASAALVLPISLSLITEAFPPEKRGAAIGMWSGVSGLGVATGPLLGGAIVQGISWQWIFWLNVPVCAVSALLSAMLLRESHGPRPRLDLVGLPMVALGLLALVWAPVRAPEIGWGSGEVIGALIAGVAVIALFVAWESRAPVPMMPLEYFRRRAFSTTNVVSFLFTFGLIGSVFWIAQTLQIGLGYSPLASGIRLLPMTMAPMIFAPIGGVLADRIGTRPVMSSGLLLMGAGYVWLGLVMKAGTGYASYIFPLFLSGMGIGLVLPGQSTAAISAVPFRDSGVASGVNNTLRETGGLFGIAVLAAVFAANGSYVSRATFLHGVRYATLVASAMAFVAVIPALLGPSKAEVHAHAAQMNAPLARPPEAAEAASSA